MRIQNLKLRNSGEGGSRPARQSSLIIEDLHAGIGEKEILKGVDLRVNPGEVHVLMGPNGSGKSTLASLLAGHPSYRFRSGSALFDGENILKLRPEERAKLGLFLAFQYPLEIAGVSLLNFLKTAATILHGPIDFSSFSSRVKSEAAELQLDPAFLTRAINEGFSGGEKKKAEILQLAILRPRLAILDETDSGLDIDALKIVAQGINRIKNSEVRIKKEQKVAILLITHYFRILKYIKPDFVHVMIEGRIVKSGGPELAGELEEKGYDWLREKNQILKTKD